MKNVTIFLLLNLFLFSSIAFAHPSEIINGLSYFTDTQNPDGLWGDETSSTEPFLATTSVIKTLQILGETSSQNYTNAIVWLQLQELETTDYLSRRINALSNGGSDLNILLSYSDTVYTNAWGGIGGFNANNLDTAVAIQALKSINHSDLDTISNALNYLTGNQNPDGGFGFSPGEDSNVYITSLVLKSLASYNGNFDLQKETDNAIAYLLTKQNPDGGFGSSLSTIFETSLAFDALIASDADLTSSAQHAINYLINNQLLNGSWNDDPYSTALALRALDSVKPNLTVFSSNISFSNTTPTVGDTITVSATIHNTGPAQAENIVVWFYDGYPESGGILIGETTIPLISAFVNSETSINWSISTPSTHEIYVIIDTLDLIEEKNETDNSASKNITAATLADLDITSDDIFFEPRSPLPGEAVTISATFRNTGETEAANTTVDFYDGDPKTGGVNISHLEVPLIPAAGTAFIEITTILAGGNHDIYVVLDQSDTVFESNEMNNEAEGTLVVGTSGDIDLSITYYDITFSPSYPVEGNPVTINAMIHNNGTSKAVNVPVRFYLGDPDGGGTQINGDITIPEIPARSYQQVSKVWDSTGHAGNNDIYVVVDPSNILAEVAETNNYAVKTIKVALTSGPDLNITPVDIDYTPQNPVKGDMVMIMANVRNIGSVDAENVNVEFSNGDPDEGGTLIIGSQTIPLIAQESSATVQIIWNTSGFSGAYEIHVNTDPFNKIPEMDETNNLAHVQTIITAPQGPALAVSGIDTTNLVTDTQSLDISGSIDVVLENTGNQDTALSFHITVFEDEDGNEKLDTGIDNILAAYNYQGNLVPAASDTLSLNLSGNIRFRGNLIYVFADSSNVVEEIDETNNIRHTGQECEYIPPVGQFNPVEKWVWTGSDILPGYNQVIHTPVVANITDDNGDGLINANDIPAIIFSSLRDNYCTDGVLRAVRGDNGQEIFTVTDSSHRTLQCAAIAVGDIDNDGLVEIVAPRSRGGIIVFEHDGTYKWHTTFPSNSDILYGGPAIADIDEDGNPEIIIANTVINSDGTLKWKGRGGKGFNVEGALSLVANVDMSGHPEIVAGNTVYRSDGTILWQNSAVGDGFNAVANFDDDPYPEIVLVSSGMVHLLEHDGTIKWGPVMIQSRVAMRGGPPTVADFDGDKKPEIGVAGKSQYVVFDTDGSIMWQSVVSDYSSSMTGSSVFDFDGDGQAEVVYNDEQYLRIYRGTNGAVLFATLNSTWTTAEYPIIADIDNDNRAEIVVCANTPGPYKTHNGIRAFEDVSDNWVNTRKIWNQHTYHITNVNDDGTIPIPEENNWETYNNYRLNTLHPGEVLHSSDLTVSYITFDMVNYPKSVPVSARIGNGGAVSHPAGVDISFYDGDPLHGGVLIGTAATTFELEKGGFVDVSVIWNAPPPGDHEVYAVADEDNIFNECRKDNNTAQALMKQPLTEEDLPDLTVSASDISIAPQDLIEGQPAVITATIHNTGILGASDVDISFYDGDPLNGSALINSVTEPFIDAGVSVVTEMPWNTLGQSGVNYIHVEIDPQDFIAESNENNNSSHIRKEVLPPTMPDLEVTSDDIAFSHQSPKEGDQVVITAKIHNLGTDAGNIKVDLYDGMPDSGGEFLYTDNITGIIQFGAQKQVSFTIDTVGLAGKNSFSVIVDPDNTINEYQEDNNSASSDLTVNSIGLNLTETTNKTQYVDNEDMLVTVIVTDLQNELRELLVDVTIVDSSGFLTASLESQPLILNPLETKTLNFVWNTGVTLTGQYSVVAIARDSALNPLVRKSVPISIVFSKGILTNLVINKISYYPNELSTITSTVTNGSANKIFEDLTATVSIRDFVGQTLFTKDYTINLLTPSSSYSFNTYWNTSTYPPGDYTIKLEVKDAGGTVLSASMKNLTIDTTFDPEKILIGQISVDSQSLLQGDPVNITYSIRNIGNIDLSGINISIPIVHVVDLMAYYTLTDLTALLMDQTYTNTQTLDTQNYSAKDYLVILRAEISGVEGILASTYFRVEGAPTAPSLNWPSEGEDIETLTPALTVNNASDPNDDELTYRFEIYTDSGLTNLLTASDMIPEGQNTTSWTVPFDLIENSRYYWRVLTYDGLLYGDWMSTASFRVNLENEPPTAPTLSSPADSSEMSTFTPSLVINNASDPDSENLTYNFELANDIGFIQIVAGEIGIFEGDGTTAWQVPVALNEDTWYYWRAQADDWFIEGPWMTPARFFVNTENNAPTAPDIIEPEDGSEITTISPDIKALNGADPESDPLTYVFEIDKFNTFDSPNRIISGSIPEGEGTTSWNTGYISNNTRYYTRSKASDGLAESQWSDVVEFFVNTINDPPTIPILANPSDGGAVNVFAPDLSIHNSFDIDGDVLTYEFELYEDSGMVNLVAMDTGVTETLQITSWTVPVLLIENKTYYWRARAFDREVHSGWMPIASFMVNTANDVPGAPSLRSPAEGSSVDKLDPTFSIYNSSDPDSDFLTYDFEIYSEEMLVQSIKGIPEDASGITSIILSEVLVDDSIYRWRARAYDGDRYGAWMPMATFSVHLPVVNITGTIDFDPNTLNQGSRGKWVVVYIELPEGYDVADIVVSSILLGDTVPSEPWPYNIGDHDKDGIPDLMVKFKRDDVISFLPAGDNIIIQVTGTAGDVTFEGFDIIRVIH
jgi:subtilase family serine protease